MNSSSKNDLLFLTIISTFKRKIKTTLKTRLQINISESFAGKPRDCVEGCGIYMAFAEKEKI
jgi:hypothetical protein